MARPPDIIREAWCLRFNLHNRDEDRGFMCASLMRQLSRCRSDEARRLILGISLHAHESRQ